MTIDQIAAAITRYRLQFGSERALQDGIERVFQELGHQFTREHPLGPAGTIDFLCGAIGIECKVSGSPSAVLAQLQRYALVTQIDSLILVTSRHTHRFGVNEIGGKPFRVVWLAGRTL